MADLEYLSPNGVYIRIDDVVNDQVILTVENLDAVMLALGVMRVN